MFYSCVPRVAAQTSMNILVLVFLVFTTAIVMMVCKWLNRFLIVRFVVNPVR